MSAMKRLGCSVLDSPAHALNLAIGPGIEGFGQAMLNAVPATKHTRRGVATLRLGKKS